MLTRFWQHLNRPEYERPHPRIAIWPVWLRRLFGYFLVAALAASLVAWLVQIVLTNL